MTKPLVLCFVLSALFTVSHCKEHEGDVIVKGGHRVVVVEYDDGDGKTNTRVLVSPPGKDEEEEEEEERKRHKGETKTSLQEEDLSSRELISDAIGKCKHKIASVLEGDNDRTSSQTGHEPHDERDQEENVWEKAKMVVRRVRTAVAEKLKLAEIGSVVGLMGIAVAYGMCVWVTFVSSYLLASVLGRQKLGVVQSKVYTVYFKAISVGILAGLLGHFISRQRKNLTDSVEMWQAVNLLSSILMVEANASFVEPRATKAMFERIKYEKEDGRGLDQLELQSSEAMARTRDKKVIEKRMTKLSERQSRLNAYSSRLNLLTFMSLTWHFVYFGHRLALPC